jgi:ABC-type branched-subunit amino acid transport system substrate-binding protein
MTGLGRRALMASAASLLSMPGLARAAEAEIFRIGGIVSFSGAYGIIGQSMRRGVEIAIAERGGKVLGKPIEALWEDDETKPQVAVQKATRMLSSGVQMFYGAIISPSTLAIMKLAEQRKIPVLVTASADDKITGSDKNHYTFRTSGNSYSENMSVVQHLKTAGTKKVYGVAADYNVMRDGWSLVKQHLASSGVEIVGEDFPPVGAGDYAVIVDKIRQSGAEAAVLVMTGNDGITFVKQAGSVGLNDKVKLMGPNLMDELAAKATGPAALGVQSAIRYHFSLDNARNRRFVDAYRKAYDDYPDPFAGEAYDGMSWWLDVVDSTASWDREKWIDAFEHSRREDSVDGLKTMQACDHQATSAGLWAEAVKGAAPLPDLTMKVLATYPADTLYPACR